MCKCIPDEGGARILQVKVPGPSGREAWNMPKERSHIREQPKQEHPGTEFNTGVFSLQVVKAYRSPLSRQGLGT